MDAEFNEISLNICTLLLVDDGLSRDTALACFKMALRDIEVMASMDRAVVMCSFHIFNKVLKAHAFLDDKIFRLARVLKQKLWEQMPHPSSTPRTLRKSSTAGTSSEGSGYCR